MLAMVEERNEHGRSDPQRVNLSVGILFVNRSGDSGKPELACTSRGNGKFQRFHAFNYTSV